MENRGKPSIETKILRVKKIVEEDLWDYTHNLIMKFPRVERYVLCKRIEDSISTMLHLIIEVKKKYYKKTTFRDLDIEVDFFRHLVRTCLRQEYISMHQFETWAGILNEAAVIVHDLVKISTKMEDSIKN